MLILKLLATFSCALFAGAALYITVAEHPTRLKQETKRAAEQWVPGYAPAARMQAPLAVISLATGAIAWLAGGDIGWLIAALVIGLVVPFTLLVIKPTNDRLFERDRDLSSRETRELLERWGETARGAHRPLPGRAGFISVAARGWDCIPAACAITLPGGVLRQ
jgi:hypothetical protein